MRTDLIRLWAEIIADELDLDCRPDVCSVFESLIEAFVPGVKFIYCGRFEREGSITRMKV